MTDFGSYLQLQGSDWELLTLLFLRMSGILMVLPVTGDRIVPTRLRVVLSLGITALLWPALKGHVAATPGLLQPTPLVLFLLTLREIVLIASVGFVSRAATIAVQMGAQMAGFSMGFQAMSLLSPLFGEQESVWGSLHQLLFAVCLLTFNGHHLILSGLHDLALQIPFGELPSPHNILPGIMATAQSLCLVSLKIAAPLVFLQMVITGALGILSRALPQLNVFVVSLPLNLGAGFLFLAVTSATVVLFFGDLSKHEGAMLWPWVFRMWGH